jgi:anti-sigma regulatory factor (Ser/Thr protein kinase)
VESILIHRWLGDVTEVTNVVDEASVSLVREGVRALGTSAGLDQVAIASLVSVASELAHNQLAHARDGRIAVLPTPGRVGVEVIAADLGPGFADPATAIQGRAAQDVKHPSLGIGLAAVLELADEVDVDVRLGEGTCIRARKLASGAPRQRCVGILGHPISGERVSGDDATFIRTSRDLSVSICDGLGHGVEAREASRLAVDRVSAAGDLRTMLADASPTLVHTRGAVMCVARVGHDGLIDLGLVGNTCAYVCSRHETRRHTGSATVLGSRTFRHALTDRDSIGTGEVLVLFSDGLSSQLSLEREDVLIHKHPIVIAQQLLGRFGTDRDDATVLVVR